jgi:hypothetical protein
MWTNLLQFALAWWWMPLVWVATFVAGLLLMRWLILRIPADYFVRVPRDWRHAPPRLLLPHLALMALKNGGGALLLITGLVMLVTPGPGLLALVFGLSLVNFPGKRQMEVRFLGQPRVLHAANRLRARHGVAPLVMPPHRSAAGSEPIREPSGERGTGTFCSQGTAK